MKKVGYLIMVVGLLPIISVFAQEQAEAKKGWDFKVEPCIKFNRFHTTSLCSPTRVALLTGRNHHLNNAGAVMELATAFQGNSGVRPNSVAPLAEMLRLNGYSTAAFGKYHETAP